MYDLLWLPSPRMRSVGALDGAPLDGGRIDRRQKSADEVETHAVRLARADHVAESKGAAGETKHESVARDEGFAGELARAIGRNRMQRTAILVGLDLAEVTVHAAARGIEKALRRGRPHRLDHIVREGGSLPEVDIRLGGGTCDVGVRCQVNHHVVAIHRRAECAEIFDIAPHNTQA